MSKCVYGVLDGTIGILIPDTPGEQCLQDTPHDHIHAGEHKVPAAVSTRTSSS